MNSRRTFLKNSGLLLAASSFPFSSFMIPQSKKKLGVALVGLGYYSRDLLAPALQLTQHCQLKGIVTGSPEKVPVWQKQYGIEDKNVYSYENMDEMADNEDIDVVYIVLPNALHKKYSVIGAEAGKHVWCEKPMAINVAECQEIINACKKNKVQLTIGYRMHHEPVTQKIITWNKSRPYGKPLKLKAEAGFYNSGGDGTHWKLFKELGGGAMFDMGVYPLNAVRYATGMEPTRVRATIERSRPEMFEADETTIFDLDFPEGITASCKTSFSESLNTLRTECEKGWYELSPFQSYRGVKGKTSDNKLLSAFQGNQQARQMDDDALAILEKSTPLVPGEEGLLDIRVVEAIFKSAELGGKEIVI
ncbi:MAG: Gfo/Idh/MocA family oxidoreductase [Lutimonas sp.]